MKRWSSKQRCRAAALSARQLSKAAFTDHRTRVLRVLALRQLVQRHDCILQPVLFHLRVTKRVSRDVPADAGLPSAPRNTSARPTVQACTSAPSSGSAARPATRLVLRGRRRAKCVLSTLQSQRKRSRRRSPSAASADMTLRRASTRSLPGCEPPCVSARARKHVRDAHVVLQGC